MSLSSCLTALLRYVFLEETINLMGWLGIVTATSGVAFVLIEGGIHHGANFSGLTATQILIGVGKGVTSAVMMALGFLLLKQGLLLGVEPLATFLRICAGGAVVWSLALLHGRLYHAMHAWTSWPVVRVLLIGCLVSTVGNCLAPVAGNTPTPALR